MTPTIVWSAQARNQFIATLTYIAKEDPKTMNLAGLDKATATERQTEKSWKPERRKDLHPFEHKSLIHLVRLAGIEPTTPWFVANIFDVF